MRPASNEGRSSGKVANLNSDLLDGKSDTDFAAAYKSTVVVSPVGTDTENGTALLAALSGITDASAANPYLLSIEPGTYDLGTATLQMKEHVDIQGSGKLNTTITSGVSDCNSINGTVNGANNVELRFLTVSNTGTGQCNTAIFNISASPRLTYVTAEATGVGGVGTENTGVYNVESSSPTMTNVTVTASGGDVNTGKFNNDNSNPTMTEATVTASGSESDNYGVYNAQSSTIIRESTLIGSTNSLFQDESIGKVANTQLVGPVGTGGGGILQCIGNYDENMDAVTCP